MYETFARSGEPALDRLRAKQARPVDGGKDKRDYGCKRHGPIQIRLFRKNPPTRGAHQRPVRREGEVGNPYRVGRLGSLSLLFPDALEKAGSLPARRTIVYAGP